jgi:NAD(P)-dependent dehydrogenase (short-subunit alcohol dehydrogenase family)
MTQAEGAGPLAGRVCIVAGASRGVGRGIAQALGEAGATVICSARSTRFGYRTGGRPETVEDAAELVAEAGGRGHPYVCDHTDARALHDFAAWTFRRFGPPDLVACAVWGGNEGFDGHAHADGTVFGTPFFRRPLSGFEAALRTGPLALIATARAFVPLMAPAGKGLLVAVGFDAHGASLGDPVWDLGMKGILDAAAIVAREASPVGVCAVHLTPGFVRTERVVDAGLAEDATESPLYAGRAVVALAMDPDVSRWAGASLFAADLAASYGFTDADGTRPARYVPLA